MSGNQGQGRPSPLPAPLWHTLGLLFLMLAIGLELTRAQSRTVVAGDQHHGNVIVYLSVIISEWALAFYVWLGGLIPGAMRLRDLIGGRWSHLKDVLRDVGIAIVFWIVFTAVAALLVFIVKPGHVESLAFLNPRGSVEISLWVVMSLSAGFCEELVFRGYVQKQFLALTGNIALALAVQAILFGIAHWYQGVRMVIVIGALGILLGILAHWRKSLRPGMIAHAWGDIASLISTRF